VFLLRARNNLFSFLLDQSRRRQIWKSITSVAGGTFRTSRDVRLESVMRTILLKKSKIEHLAKVDS
jgi:hypothetical protein